MMSFDRIKERAAQADQMIADLAKGGVAPAGEAPAIEEAAHPEPEQLPASQEAPAAPPVEDKSPDQDRPRDDAAKWEQRYRSLDGMIQARDRQIEQLHQLLAAMQQAPAKAEEPTKPAPKQKLLTPEDENAFGADLVDMARRAAREEQTTVVDELKAEVRRLQEQLTGVSQTAAVSAQDRFEAQLTAKAANWRQLDADPKFIEWLKATPMRQKLFAEAARAQSAEDVAYFFTEYAEKHAPASAPAVDPRLERQIAPGKSKTITTPAHAATTDKKSWSRSEIADLFANGKKRYSPAEFERLQRDAFAAQKEGRVDYSR